MNVNVMDDELGDRAQAKTVAKPGQPREDCHARPDSAG